MKLLKYLTPLLLMFTPMLSMAQTAANYGFENGNYTEWTVSNGSTALKTTWSDSGSGAQVTTGMSNYCPGGGKCWTVTPYGSYMLAVQAGGGSVNFDPAMTSLGLSSANITEIRTYLTGLGGNSTPTNASWIKRSVTLQAGVTYTFAWQYLSTDYVPFNDGSIITLTGGGTPTLNGQQKNYALLGFTNPGTGNYSVGSYGATGWQVAVFTVPADGTYTLGFASFNLGDTALSPILFIDQLQGTTSLNGTTFTPIQPNAGSTAPAPPSPEPTYPAATVSATQQLKINQTNTVGSNSVYIQNIGTGTSVTIEQFSRQNQVRGINGAQAAYISGNNNTLTIYQGTATTVVGNNLAEVSITGAGNTLSLTQQHNSKYAEVAITGGSNSITMQQKDVGGKSLFANIASSGNNITTTQQGSGNHFIDLMLPYGGSTVSINQSGTAQKMFSLTINSPNVGVTVSQTNSATADSAAMAITCTTGPCTGYSYTKN